MVRLGDAQDDAALNSRCLVPNTLSMPSVEMVQKKSYKSQWSHLLRGLANLLRRWSVYEALLAFWRVEDLGFFVFDILPDNARITLFAYDPECFDALSPSSYFESRNNAAIA